MSKKINPRVDIAFKKIFGVEENKDLLISLIEKEFIFLFEIFSGV